MKKFFFLSSCLTQEEEDANEKEQFFVRNGGLLLEKLISICHGSHSPFRTFSAKDLMKATDNYDPSLIFHQVYNCNWYKGSLEGRQVSVRETHATDWTYYDDLKQTTNQIAMSIKMSNHNGALKLLGCCLETKVPTLVYEFPANERLIDRTIIPSPDGRDRDRDRQPALTWKIRLKIAFEVAHFISYLHTAFPRPVLHRKIMLDDFFLDQNFVPKESNFSDSVILPENQDCVVDIDRSCEPELLRRNIFTEKTDIHSFGVLLHQLLTGQNVFMWELARGYLHVVKYAESRVKIHGIDGIVDPNIFKEVGGTKLERQQFQAVYFLAQRCVTRTVERPAITEVAKELRQIQRGLFEGDYVPIGPLLSEDDAAEGPISFPFIQDIEGEDDDAGGSMSFSSFEDAGQKTLAEINA